MTDPTPPDRERVEHMIEEDRRRMEAARLERERQRLAIRRAQAVLRQTRRKLRCAVYGYGGGGK